MPWTLETNGVKKPLADWQITGVKRTVQSQAEDTVQFWMPVAKSDSAMMFAYEQPIIVRAPDDTVWFQGVRTATPAVERVGTAEHQFTFAGPWFFLDQLVYQQPWKAFAGSTLVSFFSARVFLGWKLGGPATAQVGIRDILQFAIDRGAPLQIGIISANVYPPVREETNTSCAQALRLLMAFVPDGVSWLDYSTTPPTFHFRPRAELTAAVLPVNNNEAVDRKVVAHEILSREDLQRPSVKLTYEQTNTTDGKQRLRIVEDIYPPTASGLEMGGLVQVINLAGFSVTTVNGDLTAEPITTASLDWWKQVIPSLKDDRIDVTGPVAGSVSRFKLSDGTVATGLPQRMVAGQWYDWMELSSGEPLLVERERVGARFSFQVWSGPASDTKRRKIGEPFEQFISFDLVSTNAPAGDSSYEALESFEDGDPQPVGLAQYLYNALSPLQYQGSVRLEEQECSGAAKLGQVLNLTGGAAAWAGMNGLIQAVAEDIDQGVTEVRFAPGPQFGPMDLVELLRVSRIRRRWTRKATQDDGEFGSGGKLSLGRETADNNAVLGHSQTNYLEVGSTLQKTRLTLDGNKGKLILEREGVPQRLNLDLANVNWTRELAVVELKVCVANDPDWYIQVIASDAYKKA